MTEPDGKFPTHHRTRYYDARWMLRPGDQVARYRIEKFLGEGGMGRVYRAYDTLLGRQVALKVLGAAPTGSDGSSEASTARLFREARAAAMLDHPNVVAIFDIGQADERSFIAMECVDGRSLRGLVGDPTIDLSQRIAWLVQIGRALGAAHRIGIVHRDVKPENVMVRHDGVAKVLDFGIAKRASGTDAVVEQTQFPTLTAEGVAVGTPYYMAPEQMRGEPVDGRADQFAWGVLGYELLTGRLPWSRGAPGVQLVAEILSKEPEPAESLEPAMPAEVAACLHKALAKSRDARHASMEEATASLEPFAATVSIPLPTEPATTQEPETRSVDTGAPTEMDAVRGSVRKIVEQSTPEPRVAVPNDGKTLRARFDQPHSSTMCDAALSDAVEPSTPSERANPSPSPRRSWRWLAFGAFAVAVSIASVMGVQRWSRSLPIEQTSAPGTSSSARPTKLLDHPPPPTSNPEAAAAYRAGMAALNENDVNGAISHLETAVRRDPRMAAAHLRLALFYAWFRQPERSLAEFEHATKLRSDLSEREQAILDAARVYADTHPLDRELLQRRMRALGERFPLDEEVAAYEMVAHFDAGDFASMRAAASRTLSINPAMSEAWNHFGIAAAFAGDRVSAQRAWERCIELAPTSFTCSKNTVGGLGDSGDCEGMIQAAEQWRKRSPATPTAYFKLAEAHAATGQSDEMVLELVSQGLARLPEPQRENEAMPMRASLAVLRGRWAEAETLARALSDKARGSTARTAHGSPARLLASIYVETGRLAEAAKIADRFLQRREAWIPEHWHENTPLLDDATPFMLGVARESGLLDDQGMNQRREALLTEWKAQLPTAFVNSVWYYAYAAPSRTGADASLAYRELRAYEPLPALASAWESAARGWAALLAGRFEEARESLTAATRNCNAFDEPLTITRAHLHLGLALEKLGEKEEACRAFGVVLDRWGAARTPSVSAKEAKTRWRALSCASADTRRR